jgi:hypothetical protein
MEGLIVLAVLCAIGYSLYRAGKRTGSIKGFHAALHRRFRRR